jgi:ABC-type multidrug transport system ATPase subunit
MFSVRIEELAKTFGSKTIFRGLSTTIDAPIYGIKGANGSGKSTLIRCLVYLISPSSGQIRWFNNAEEIKKDDLKQFLGIAAPYFGLYPQLSVAENVNFIRKLRAKSPLKQSSELGYDLLLEEIWELNYQSLSTGQQQRACIAAAVSHQPEVLILDEPGANLDEKGHQLIADLVAKRKEQGLLTIIASNDPREWAWCDKFIDLSL